MNAILSRAFDQQGRLQPDAIAACFLLSKADLAHVAGLSRDAVSKTARRYSPATQKRLRDMVEIINRVLPWAGSPMQAMAWYRSQPLPGFGDITAEQLVKQGRAQWVHEYIDRIAEGGYA